MSFKDKPLKKLEYDDRVTIDVLHKRIVNSNIDKKTTLLNKISEESSDYKIKKLKKESYKAHTSIINYYFDNAKILSDYYEKKNKSSTKTIFDLIDKNKKDSNLIDKYMSNIDDEKLICQDETKNYICSNCNNVLLLDYSHSILLCEICGNSEYTLISLDKNSYNDVPRETSHYAYKRINHFNEWLMQFQAKESTDISKDLIESILLELKKQKITKESLDVKKLRLILKKKRLNKYYENIPQILNIITGKNAPLIERSDEDTLRMMFKEIQLPFQKNCPSNRKNFLSYSYVLNKFCELLELDNLLPHFVLLKSREKLQAQDDIWKKICHDLNWEYIATI
jgi:hypothetical protein